MNVITSHMRTNIANKETAPVSSGGVPRKRKPVEPGGQVHLSVMVDADTIRAADKEAERLGKELGLRLTRTDIVRRWLDSAAKSPRK